MRLGIGMMSNRDWKPRFGIGLVMLTNHLGKRGIKGRKLEDMTLHPMLNCSIPQKGRRMVLEDAIKENCTHLLFVDDDMVFHADSMDYLARGDHAMIAANYQSRSNVGESTAISLEGGRLSSKGKTGQEEVDRVGFGLALIDLSYVKKMPQPWFAVPWLPEKHTELGEDYFFCMLLKKHGGKIFVDHDVSNNVIHMGETDLRTP